MEDVRALVLSHITDTLHEREKEVIRHQERALSDAAAARVALIRHAEDVERDERLKVDRETDEKLRELRKKSDGFLDAVNETFKSGGEALSRSVGEAVSRAVLAFHTRTKRKAEAAMELEGMARISKAVKTGHTKYSEKPHMETCFLSGGQCVNGMAFCRGCPRVADVDADYESLNPLTIEDEKTFDCGRHDIDPLLVAGMTIATDAREM